MEKILEHIYQEAEQLPDTLGILKVNKQISPLTDTYDVIIVVVSEVESLDISKQYQYGNEKIAVYTVTNQQIKDWILRGTNRKMIGWIHGGQIVYDKNNYLYNIRRELSDFPFYERKIKLGIEFAKLIRRYMIGKSFFETGQYIDTYNHMIHCLHHLARLVVIEKGFHPELTVWSQVKALDPEIFKLYKELVTSDESTEKRLELLFIASDFLIHTRTISGASHLMELLEEQDQWSMNEIKAHPEANYYGIDLELLIEYLVDKDFIEVIEVETTLPGLFERYYRKK